MKNPKLEHAEAILIDEVRSYESDTFSAEGSEITLDEAQEIASKFISRIIDNTDGVTISAMLDTIRENVKN